jgi:peptide/nickel transport system substrate-binding protein
MGERSRWVPLAAAMVVALVLGACDGGGGGEGEEPGPGEEAGAPADDERADDHLVVGTTEPISTIDPARCNDHACATVLRNTTNGLFGFAPGEEAGEPVPELVDGEPEVEPSQLTYSFTLRDDVVFHDGSELSAEDVRFSLERARDIAHPDGAGYLLAGIEEIETPDRLTVEITLREPDVNFEQKLAHHVAAILPADGPYTKPDEPLDDPAEADEYLNEDELVATGPYRLADLEPGASVTYERFEEHWDAPPSSREVTTRIYEDGAQLLSALQDGEIDVAYRHLSPQQEAELEDGGDVEIVEGDGAEPRYLVLNPALEPFDDPNVRQAVAAAIDRQRILDDVFDGEGAPLYSVVPEGADGTVPAFDDLYEDASPDDFIDEPVDFELHVATDLYGENESALAGSLQAMLEETGLFDVEVRETDWRTLQDEAWPGGDGEYAAFLLGSPPGDLVADSHIERLLGTGPGSLALYENEDIARLLEEAAGAEEPEGPERQEALRAIQQVAAEEVPVVPLIGSRHVAYVRDGVSGVEDALDETQIFRYWVMWRHG